MAFASKARILLAAGAVAAFATNCPRALAEQKTFPNLSPSDSQSIDMACELNAAKKSKPVTGPNGVSASIIIESRDDYIKESHDCEAGYIINVSPDPKLKGLPFEGFMSSDAEWERHVSARIVGFSQDGNWVVGFLSQDGQYPFSYVFSYNIRKGSHFAAETSSKRQAPGKSASCAPIAIAGVTAQGRPVIYGDHEHRCGGRYQWVADPGTGLLQPLPKTENVSSLYSRHAK